VSGLTLNFYASILPDNLDKDKAGSGDDVIDDGDRGDNKIDDEDDDEDANDDDDVTITDNDVKEALAASSGELPASGQPISDVEASGSHSEAPVTQSQGKENDTVVKGESEDQKTASDSQKLVSEPPKEAVQAPPQDNSAQKVEEEAPKEEEDADKEQSKPEQVENVEDINAETPPSADSDKQATDSTVQDDDTPPPDETQQMKEAQTKYAEDQQEEKALSYLANGKKLFCDHIFFFSRFWQVLKFLVSVNVIIIAKLLPLAKQNKQKWHTY